MTRSIILPNSFTFLVSIGITNQGDKFPICLPFHALQVTQLLT